MKGETKRNGAAKLLAVVMVMAVALVGAFCIIGAESTDAADGSGGASTSYAVKIGDTEYNTLSDAISDAIDGDRLVAQKAIAINTAVTVDKNITIDMATFSLTIGTAGKLIIDQQKDVTITNSATSVTNLITINYNEGSTEATSAIEMKTGSVLDIAHNGIGTDNSGKCSIYTDGPAKVTMTTATLRYTTDRGVQNLNYVATGGSTIDGTSIAHGKTLAGYFNLSGSTVNANDVGVYAAVLDADSTINARQIGIYNGTAAIDTVFATTDKGSYELCTIANSGKIIADKIVFGLSGTMNADAPITISGSGRVSADVELVDTGSNTKFILKNGASFSGTVIQGDNRVVVSNIKAITSDATGLSFSHGSIVINGTPASTTNGRITVSSGAATITGTVPADVTLVIEEGATVAVTDFTNNGTVEVYGTLSGNITNTNGKVVLTPESDVSGTITGGSIVQDADMSVPFYIGGELEKSMEIGNATLNDGLHIPEGKTLTVDGDLFLNGNDITVDGELVITKNGCIYTITDDGSIIISKGTITNNGVIGNAKAVSVKYGGYDIVKMQGVSGVNFTVKKIDGANKVIVSGDIERISAVKTNELTVYQKALVGDLTVAKKVKLVLNDDVTSTSGAVIVVDGEISSSSSKTLTLGNNATFTLNGKSVNVTVKAQTGELGDNNAFAGTPADVTVYAGTNATGYTIYTKKVPVTVGSSTKYYMRAYILGDIDRISSTVTDENPNKVTITGEFYVASAESLTFSKNVTCTFTDAKAIIEGVISFENKDYEDAVIAKYIGAYYSVTTGEGSSKVSTLYYTTFDAAIAKIADVDDKTINSTVEEIESDFTVAADQTVKFTGTTVSSKATVTVESDGTVEKIAMVEGMVVVKDGATCSIPTSGYAAKSVSADNTVTYAGLKIAIENAVSGDVITISSGETTESLTIPAGVTVIVSNDLKVGGNLTVSEGAKLVVKGTLTMTSTKAVTVDVIGTLDLSEGSYVQGSAALKSTGTAILSNATGVNFSGAYYIADGNTVITTVQKAVEGAASADVSTVNVKGTVNETSDIALKDMTLTIDQNAKVKLGTITLENSKVMAGATADGATPGKLTATIVGMNGDGDKAVSSSVKLSESSTTVTQTAVTKADDTVSNKFTINGVDGTVTIASGKVNFANDVTVSGENKLIVDSGATLTLDKDLNVTGTMAVNGTVDVVGKTLTLNSGKAEISGTVNITKAGNVILANAVITGTIDVKSETDKDNKLTINGNGMTFGKAVESIGATATISGKVVFGSGVNYIVAYSGVDLSKAVFNPDTVTGESTAVTTTYMINGVEYATVYAQKDSTAYKDAITLAMIKDIKGLDFTGFDAANFYWYNTDGTKADGKVGDASSVVLDVPVSKKKVTISVGTGISLYIDNVKYNSGSTPELTVGDHKITASVNPGYKGTVDIVVNDVKITSGTFTIALDGETVISATGDITVDSGSAVVEKDDGMDITDILLIVLVVLIAVMAVMVALRMMRS